MQNEGKPEQVKGHTPGPWLADFHNEQRNGGRFITHVHGGNQLVPIAAVPTGVEGYGREEGRANARLIAAAPDLLAALIAFVDGDNSDDMDTRYENARAALSRTGAA